MRTKADVLKNGVTVQTADYCQIDCAERPLWPSPLESVVAALGRSPIASDLCSACHRGYVARWELRDESLYLLAVDHWRGDGVRVDFGAPAALSSRLPPLAEPLPTSSRCNLDQSHLLEVSAWLASPRGGSLRAGWVQDSWSLCMTPLVPADHIKS